MNHEYWKGELTIYEEEAVSSDEGEICILHRNITGLVTLNILEGYKLVESFTEGGVKVYTIEKENLE